MGFRLEIYWASDGEGEGAIDIFEPLPPLGDGKETLWDEWRVCYHAVACDDTSSTKPPVWGVCVFKHKPPAGGGKLVSARANWHLTKAYCLHAAKDIDEYMEWLDEQVDLITRDNITFFAAQRVKDGNKHSDSEKSALDELISALIDE